jgi:hypothetical protein
VRQTGKQAEVDSLDKQLIGKNVASISFPGHFIDYGDKFDMKKSQI